MPGLSGGDRKILLSVFLSGGGEVESGEVKLFCIDLSKYAAIVGVHSRLIPGFMIQFFQ